VDKPKHHFFAPFFLPKAESPMMATPFHQNDFGSATDIKGWRTAYRITEASP
jgi:hypothetical protein